MDKNTIIGFVLIAAVIIGFTLLNQPSAEDIARQKEQFRKDSIEYAQTLLKEQEKLIPDTSGVKKENAADDFFAASAQEDSVSIAVDSLQNAAQQAEQFVTLENDKLKIVFSTKGGQMVSARLKDYMGYNVHTKDNTDSLYLFNNNDAEFSLLLTNRQRKVLRTSDLNFTPIQTDSANSLIMRYSYSANQHIDFVYKLSDDNYMMKYDINLVGLQPMLDRDKADLIEMTWSHKMRRQEKSLKNEQRYSHVYYKYVGGDVKELSADKNDEVEVKEPAKWIAFKNQFFAPILIADEKIETVLLESKILAKENEDSEYLKACSAHIYTPGKVDMNDGTMRAGFTYYMGPMSYTALKNYDSHIKDVDKQLDLDKLVPLGWTLFRWVNQYFVIPIFNFLRGTGLSMGIVILLLTIIVKLVISPLTYKSFMSSAKMRVLRPQVEELNAKFPKQEQAMEKQQATMALYNKAGVNPMSGCIPLLLQMPILIALFQFFPNAIELRQQSFLWANDLSTYDAIIEWGSSIPLIGSHISLFCILMTITNIIYTKFNMEMTNTGQQQMPGMKWMMYLMPLIFLFVLNDFPSGLTYYYFLSLLITILLTIGFRYMIDEEKVLAKLEANKAKPKKKSGFMARLEEAQRLQQQQLKEKNKTNSTKRKR
ncbi:YidC/Oxa1 family membrane protein insertase [Dysgonomonas sp. PFB1-18]|uniref:membrane protein insertase YidC n=1 Tax=unclassified Dysgonomonas TaxID=2630389 RepID=UPI0024765533|nr:MULTISPECIES: membrane protein insertase YidC [unclassified Dysgonomonas]MDL2303565.1 membrane protein insertase YidC [Dysgonomonas sp. OttesenSCG-928-D17]MDH6310631.1 YidC/Oxa1 family membrane protein insertase [Dysgonomonas sp. PF1-14]MDH6340482.1 YidC/Oxa1 family membrane protein insertase [Dysgonomonas sp. PF1-16]MDH6382110.1 YidC/Oxa1 family membrane protein insertase [Dysgonomonas sp. PFB1-18]MDH6399454.1 YidC/Oxa1 family membrane protein insertase [Dysgonomonas sp. PF1-23]